MDSPLVATRRAFDSVAAAYDGPLGNNLLIQRMRAKVMDTVERTFSRGARLLDLGCGTGIDAAYLAARGYDITALDVSPEMVARTSERLRRGGLNGRAVNVGIHELAHLDAERFDGAYSNLGALNCLPELQSVSAALKSKLKPSGLLVASVIGRYCPWEILVYAARGSWRRAFLRMRRGMVPVPMNGETVWTRYYTPREFTREFRGQFEPVSLRALALFEPPPYLVHQYMRFPRPFEWLGRLDHLLGGKPLFRQGGDHFLMVLRAK